jgi:hypothetical protein
MKERKKDIKGLRYEDKSFPVEFQIAFYTTHRECVCACVCMCVYIYIYIYIYLTRM